MKKIFPFFLLMLLVSTCKEQTTNKKELVNKSTSTENVIPLPDTLLKADSSKEELQISTITNQPCKAIINFAAEIKNKNWVPDTLRLKKVNIYPELDQKSVKYFGGNPFYTINFEKSRIATSYVADTAAHSYNLLESKNFDFNLFRSVENIWAYFYRDKETSDWISDGVIEQWEFTNETNAQKALEQIEPIGGYIYFNTNPYFCRIDNKLLIFQSRAMAFSYDQAKVFDQFIKEFKPEQE